MGPGNRLLCIIVYSLSQEKDRLVTYFYIFAVNNFLHSEKFRMPFFDSFLYIIQMNWWGLYKCLKRM